MLSTKDQNDFSVFSGRKTKRDIYVGIFYEVG